MAYSGGKLSQSHSFVTIERLTAIWSLYTGPITACLGLSGLSAVVKEKHGMLHNIAFNMR